MADEYIKRSDAIMAVTRAKLPDTTPEGVPIANGKRSVADCVRRIKAIPAVAPQRPHGRWKWISEVDFSLYYFECSECQHHAYGNTASIMMGEYHYCPNCGAKMDAEEVDNG